MKMLGSVKQRYVTSAAMVILAVGMSASPACARATDVLVGGNINERFTWATPQALDQTHTTWLRGFILATTPIGRCL